MTIAESLRLYLSMCLPEVAPRIALSFHRDTSPSPTYLRKKGSVAGKLLWGTVEGVSRHGFVVHLDLGYRTFVSWVDLWQGASGSDKGGASIKGPVAAVRAMSGALGRAKKEADWAFLATGRRDFRVEDEMAVSAGGGGS